MDPTRSAIPSINPIIEEFYTDRYDEADRLGRDAIGRLERDRTRELLRRFLPAAPARVLDVGGDVDVDGGPGVHAAWLAELGYQVTVIDPVARHRDQAGAHGTFTVEDRDARALTHADASADVVLLLGPMYHLVEAADRARALAEARRVVRPGGAAGRLRARARRRRVRAGRRAGGRLSWTGVGGGGRLRA